MSYHETTEHSKIHPDKSANGKDKNYSTYSFWKDKELNKMRVTVFLTSHSVSIRQKNECSIINRHREMKDGRVIARPKAENMVC